MTYLEKQREITKLIRMGFHRQLAEKLIETKERYQNGEFPENWDLQSA